MKLKIINSGYNSTGKFELTKFDKYYLLFLVNNCIKIYSRY